MPRQAVYPENFGKSDIKYFVLISDLIPSAPIIVSEITDASFSKVILFSLISRNSCENSISPPRDINLLYNIFTSVCLLVVRTCPIFFISIFLIISPSLFRHTTSIGMQDSSKRFSNIPISSKILVVFGDKDMPAPCTLKLSDFS